MTGPLPDLFACVRQVLALCWPGRTPRRVIIETVEGERIVLPVPGPVGPAQPTPPPRTPEPALLEPPADEPTPGDTSGWSRLYSDIFATLEEVGHRLTTTRLLSEMAKREREWSRRHVERALKALMDEGALVNEPRGRPPGYWLADVPHPPE